MMHRTLSQSAIGTVALLPLIITMSLFGQVQKPQRTGRGKSAAEVMKLAHNVRAEWSGFSGFKAKVTVMSDSNRVDGTVIVSAEGKVDLQLGDSPLAKWASSDLQSLVDHRMPSGSREYDVAFVQGERANALGRLIRFNDDRMHSVYRVRYNVITEVHRTMENRKLMINVVDVQRNKDKKILPRTYTVSMTDIKTGKVNSTQLVNNRWVRIGKLDLPARILKIISRADGGREVQEIRLSDHELLGGAE